LDFTQFSTEEDHDMVKVYNGENASIIGEFSGSDTPDPIEVETSTILLIWTTNSTS